MKKNGNSNFRRSRGNEAQTFLAFVLNEIKDESLLMSALTIHRVLIPTVLGLFLLNGVISSALTAEPQSDSDHLIHWLLDEERALKGIPFSNVVYAVSGKKILPIDSTREGDKALLDRLGKVVEEVLARMNQRSDKLKARRINEVSAQFEDEFLKTLNQTPGFTCSFPRTAAGKIQRSGYPDLRLQDQASGRVFYLDPKLYETGSEASTFRTFYFEPKKETNKILEDAHHLLIGIEHNGKEGGRWRFTGWQLVDVALCRVQLKAEFQTNNRELYHSSRIVKSGKL